MATANRIDIIQSYILTTAKYDFSVYEKRILYRIVQTIQRHLEGKKLKTSFKDTEDKNYPRIKKAFEDLQRKFIKYEDNEIWFSSGIIGGVTLQKRAEYVEFLLINEFTNLF